MNTLQPSQVVANANSKMCQIEALVNDRSTPTPERMVEIARLADEFRAAVAGCTADPFRAAESGPIAAQNVHHMALLRQARRTA